MFLQQKPAPQVAPSPTPPPHILYNPAQHMLTYTGFCPSGQTLPAYPNYPIPIQVGTTTHLYTTGIHVVGVDDGLMMSSGRTVKQTTVIRLCLSLRLAAQQQLSAFREPSARSRSRTCVQRRGEPEPAASSGRRPAAASWSWPGSRRLHADP